MATSFDLVVRSAKALLATIALEKMIRHEGGKFHVYSADGSKSLGSYDTKEEALTRLRQVEGHKEKASVAKDDMTDASLDSGGRLVPEQGIGPKQRRNYQGITVIVDRPEGFVQTGKDAEGKEWSRTYKTDYGYIPGTLGGDGEGLDVFIGPDTNANDVHWAIQKRGDGTFDEYKCMLGFMTKGAAEACYKDHIPGKYLHGMATTTVHMMKALLGLEPVEVMKAILADYLGRDFAAAASSAEGATRTINLALAAARTDAPMPPNELGPPRGAWVTKADEQRYVLGPVLVPDTTDAQGDTYSAPDIELAAWRWMSEYLNTGIQHKALANGLIIPVESYVVRADTNIGGSPIKAGTWMLGALIKDDKLWSGVKSGAWQGWSIEGFAKKTPLGAGAPQTAPG